MKIKIGFYPLFLSCCTFYIHAEEYEFSPAMLRGSGLSGIAALSDEDSFYKPGKYDVSVYLNNKLFSKKTVDFEMKGKKLTPVFTGDFINSLPLKKKPESLAAEERYVLEAVLPEAKAAPDLSSLRVNIVVPQSLLVQRPDDYIPASEFDAGSTVLFSNYTVNQYESHNSYSGALSSTYLGLSSGFNAGKWQFRQQGNFSRNRYGSRWDSSRFYVKRGLPLMRSELSIGQLSSSSETFSGLSFTGVSLKTDNRVLPPSLVQYAPTVRGTARTNAKVEVFQKKYKIYETTVPPGNFSIDDLAPAFYGGDLKVRLTESDGSITEYAVPYSTLPGSVRPGRLDYAFSAGKISDYARFNQFSEYSVKYGVSNTVTANSGLRVGSGYQAASGGAIYSSALGAFGTSATWSNARLKKGRTTQGWIPSTVRRWGRSAPPSVLPATGIPRRVTGTCRILLLLTTPIPLCRRWRAELICRKTAFRSTSASRLAHWAASMFRDPRRTTMTGETKTPLIRWDTTRPCLTVSTWISAFPDSTVRGFQTRRDSGCLKMTATRNITKIPSLP
nr:fimbria/pilus outer membrane usher protein [Pantoea stewartii]